MKVTETEDETETRKKLQKVIFISMPQIIFVSCFPNYIALAKICLVHLLLSDYI